MKGFPLYLPNLYGEHRSGHYRGQHVADGVGAPHAVETEEMWQDIQQWYHEYDLAGKREKHRLAGHAERLEEVGRHHLESYHPEGYCGYADAVHSTFYL